MTANELITLFRRNAEDASYTYDTNMPSAMSLWSNFQLLQYMDQAQKEFAEKTYCFKDNYSFTLAVAINDSEVYYDPKIIKIERAESLADHTILDISSMEEFQMSAFIDDYGIKRGASWEIRTGKPSTLITDIALNAVRLYPIPNAVDTIKLTVRRYPLRDIESLDDELEVPQRFQYGLLYKMQSEAFKNPKALISGYGDAAVAAKADWDSFITDAYKHFRVKTQGPGKIRYGGL
jgi:hypothetical protein